MQDLGYENDNQVRSMGPAALELLGLLGLPGLPELPELPQLPLESGRA